MEPLPLPSLIHYELILQLLERQTAWAVHQNPLLKEEVRQLIITLRKALAQQKQLEIACDRLNYPVEHRWALNSVVETPSTPTVLPQTRPPET